MRLKAGKSHYKMPNGVHIQMVMVHVGKNVFNLQHVNAKDLHMVPNRFNKLNTIPIAWAHEPTYNIPEIIRIFPTPKKAYRITVAATKDIEL